MKPWTSCDLDQSQASREGFAHCKDGTPSAGKRLTSAEAPRAVLLTGQYHPQNSAREVKMWPKTLQGLRNTGISLEIVNVWGASWGIRNRNKNHREVDHLLQDYSKKAKLCRQRVGFEGLCTPLSAIRPCPHDAVLKGLSLTETKNMASTHIPARSGKEQRSREKIPRCS